MAPPPSDAKPYDEGPLSREVIHAVFTLGLATALIFLIQRV